MASADENPADSNREILINGWRESDIKAAKELIEATVLHILFKALCKLVKERPDDPVQFVIDFLLKYKDGFPQDYELSEKKIESRRLKEKSKLHTNHWVEIYLATNSRTEEPAKEFYNLNIVRKLKSKDFIFDSTEKGGR